MKKYKVNIPEGYYVESTTTDAPPTSIQINLKPIKKQLAKTWEEYKVDTYHTRETKSVTIVMPPSNMNAFCALSQLVELRDHYNDGWEPDWTDDSSKYVIYVYRTSLSTTMVQYAGHVLSFKTVDLRDKFLSNFRDLIETAKCLL